MKRLIPALGLLLFWLPVAQADWITLSCVEVKYGLSDLVSVNEQEGVARLNAEYEQQYVADIDAERITFIESIQGENISEIKIERATGAMTRLWFKDDRVDQYRCVSAPATKPHKR